MRRLERFLERIRGILHPGSPVSTARPAMPHPEMLMKMIFRVSDDEIDCDHAFDLMHQYADLVDSGQDARALLPVVHRHIELCRDCREELEALLRAIHGDGT